MCVCLSVCVCGCDLTRFFKGTYLFVEVELTAPTLSALVRACLTHVRVREKKRYNGPIPSVLDDSRVYALYTVGFKVILHSDADVVKLDKHAEIEVIFV